MKKKIMLFACIFLICLCTTVSADEDITYDSFLTWNKIQIPAKSTFNHYLVLVTDLRSSKTRVYKTTEHSMMVYGLVKETQYMYIIETYITMLEGHHAGKLHCHKRSKPYTFDAYSRKGFPFYISDDIDNFDYYPKRKELVIYVPNGPEKTIRIATHQMFLPNRHYVLTMQTRMEGKNVSARMNVSLNEFGEKWIHIGKNMSNSTQIPISTLPYNKWTIGLTPSIKEPKALALVLKITSPPNCIIHIRNIHLVDKIKSQTVVESNVLKILPSY